MFVTRIRLSTSVAWDAKSDIVCSHMLVDRIAANKMPCTLDVGWWFDFYQEGNISIVWFMDCWTKMRMKMLGSTEQQAVPVGKKMLSSEHTKKSSVVCCVCCYNNEWAGRQISTRVSWMEGTIVPHSTDSRLPTNEDYGVQQQDRKLISTCLIGIYNREVWSS